MKIVLALLILLPTTLFATERPRFTKVTAAFYEQDELLPFKRLDFFHALTREQLQAGYQNFSREEMGNGMIFGFVPPREVTMWMKDTFVSLDMLFIRNETIIKIITNIPANSTELIHSPGPIDAVLELPAGMTRTYGLKEGHNMTILTPIYIK